jgi:hypothetical protein
MFLPKKLMEAIAKKDIRKIIYKLQVFPGIAKIRLEIPVAKGEFQFLYKNYAKYKNIAIKKTDFEDYVKDVRSVGAPEETYKMFTPHIQDILTKHICNDKNKLVIDSFEIKSVVYYGLNKGFEEVFFMRIDIDAYPTEDYMSRLL